jgi:hypothetical protein
VERFADHRKCRNLIPARIMVDLSAAGSDPIRNLNHITLCTCVQPSF